MPNPNKAKGSRWERDLVLYLRERLDLPVVRTSNELGVGDLGNLPLLANEAKNEAGMRVWAYLDQAASQAVRACVPFAVVWVKRRNASAARGAVAMQIDQFTELYRDYVLPSLACDRCAMVRAEGRNV
ncbi:hypothetical protein GCM10012275_56520 [Longimycelium tulufanense]|uniref:Uncharacterized protein n=1 Tax=Longimycelium tulufanense TaxID=907463 RepID=A0A8J3FXC8_9PSEU|nr:hypothetical protein [Longimycelium tulufanense]GGM78588.1 hypothetical protein GCM10012275_56520 [Longimycelium tulufanense]